MIRNIIIVLLVMVIAAQYGWSRLKEAAGKSSFSVSVVRASMFVFNEMMEEKEVKRRDAMLKIAIEQCGKEYKYSNGNTDLFFRITDGFLAIQ
jgi:uncharacterized membrane protein YhhN